MDTTGTQSLGGHSIEVIVTDGFPGQTPEADVREALLRKASEEAVRQLPNKRIVRTEAQNLSMDPPHPLNYGGPPADSADDSNAPGAQGAPAGVPEDEEAVVTATLTARVFYADQG